MSIRKVGITGIEGFIGYHLATYLRLKGDDCILVPYSLEMFKDRNALRQFVESCDVIVHLAGMNRGEDNEVHNVNVDLANQLAAALRGASGPREVVFSSSTQVTLDNAYGKSKAKATEILAQAATATHGHLTTLVIPNVFGPFARPFYNSGIATFCHQLTHGEQPAIIKDVELRIVYVLSLVRRIFECIVTPPSETVTTTTVKEDGRIRVSEILVILKSMDDAYVGGIIPSLEKPLDVALFNTLRSYFDDSFFPIVPVLREDQRGFLFEIVRARGSGQAFYSITKPGQVRGNHFHLRKVERFCVVSGEALIRLRRVGTDRVVEYRVNGGRPSFVDMPILTTHNIENVGTADLCTLFWSNELFDPNDPDTYFEKV